MRRANYAILGIVALAIGSLALSKQAHAAAPDDERVQAWAKLLPAAPRGLGPTIDDRRAWQTVADAENFTDAVPNAEKLLSQPIPELTDDLYLDYSRTGNRSRCEKVIRERRGRIDTLVLAECIENRGRFLPAIEEAIRATCADKTWMYPAHDVGQANFKGNIVEIDLFAGEAGWHLATARYWLGDKLSPDVRKLIDDELDRRIFAPFTGMVTEGKPRTWWLVGTNNWNAVCIAEVTGAAMANIESRERRAFFAASAEKYIQFFLSGFTPDGYCSEGVGYWNYGFGNFVMLAELLKQATGGKIDMMDSDHVRQIAMYSRRIEILPGVFPAFSDSDPSGRPDAQIMAFLSRRYGWGLKDVEAKGLGLAQGRSRSSFALGLYGFPNSATMTPAATVESSAIPLRDNFADAGILICRPAPGSAHALGLAIKGGHNAEVTGTHDQLDIGSYTVALGHSTPILDPGAEDYTARTFSKHRFDSKVLNSFGHPVPRVAGQLQAMGKGIVAKVVKTDFTDAADTLVLDLSAAYKVDGLKKLERTFVFARGGGKITVTDAVEFDSPQEFGTALITFGPWKLLAPNRLQLGEKLDSVVVEIVAEGGEFQVTPEEIHENLRGGHTPTRLGIDLTKPAARATITLTITPQPPAAAFTELIE
jgi:hypothetical protein